MKILQMKSVKRFYVKYFNGFSLKAEEALFEEYTTTSETCVVGFSYGAQKAFEYVYTSNTRIDKLILLSPAFFQTNKSSFIRTQLRYFEAAQKSYVEQFLLNVAHPSNLKLSDYLKLGTKDELEALLTYVWDQKKIQELLDRNITIEVFLGEKDKIIDSAAALAFFSQTTIYFIKNSGHLLKDTL